MSFESNLKKIAEDLEKHKNHNRSEVLQRCIQQRLESSLTQYYKELGNSLSYLSSSERDKISVAKKINKEV